MPDKNYELIKQALGAAESSIKLAKQLLSELESKAGSSNNAKAAAPGADLPGIVGTFDGENMVSESGETYPVPANYASKSLLIVGDSLKLVTEGKEKRFKQIDHVKRHKTSGILTKKEGKWKVVTPEGSYRVLPAAVEHFGADIGSEISLHIPANNLTVSWGALESVKAAKKEASDVVEEKPETTEVVAEKKPEKVETKAETKAPELKPAEVKEVVKTVVKPEPVPAKPAPKPKPAPKKEEPKKLDKPVEVKPTPPPTPVEVAKPKPEPKPEPKSVPAPAAETKPVPAVEDKPMEVTPEEDELT